jgi:hypothetical protein
MTFNRKINHANDGNVIYLSPNRFGVTNGGGGGSEERDVKFVYTDEFETKIRMDPSTA